MPKGLLQRLHQPLFRAAAGPAPPRLRITASLAGRITATGAIRILAPRMFSEGAVTEPPLWPIAPPVRGDIRITSSGAERITTTGALRRCEPRRPRPGAVHAIIF